MNQEELFLQAIIAETEMQMFVTKIVLGMFIAFIVANLIYYRFFANTRANQRRWRQKRFDKRMSIKAKQRRDIQFARRLRGKP